MSDASASTENEPSPASSRYGMAAIVGLVVAVIALLETGRRFSVPLPVPFLLLYGTVAIGASLAGLRAGIAAATLASCFVIYSATIGYGPASLTGGVLQVIAGTGIAFVIGGLIGRGHDTKKRLIVELKQREASLAVAQAELARKVDRRNDQLAGASAEVAKLRSRISSATRHSPAGVVVVDKDRNIETVNGAAARMFGLVSMVQVRTDIDDFLQNMPVYIDGERGGGDHTGPLKAALLEGKISDNVEIRVDHPDGNTLWLRGCFAPIRNEMGGIDGATVILIDITEKQLAGLKLQDLARQLIHVQETERAYIARELHDEIGQHLTGIKMHMHAAAGKPDNRQLLDSSIERLDELMTVVRNLSLELRPSVLDDLGLVAALRWYLGRQKLPDGGEILLESDAATDALSPEAVTATFRIVQEAVTNALRHAKASKITVRLYNDQDDFCVDVIDDGIGYVNGHNGEDTTPENGFGLVFMRERVNELNGKLKTVTSPGDGTRVEARIPIQVTG